MFAMEAADSWHPPDLRVMVERYESIHACRLFDDRIEQLAVTAEISNELN